MVEHGGASALERDGLILIARPAVSEPAIGRAAGPNPNPNQERSREYAVHEGSMAVVRGRSGFGLARRSREGSPLAQRLPSAAYELGARDQRRGRRVVVVGRD